MVLKLEISEQSNKFRTEFRAWLINNPPPLETKDSSLDEFVKRGRSWQQKLSSGSWIGVHWPKEFGGRSLSLVEEAIIQEELVRVNAPQILGLFGLTMVGPVLIKHGTVEQKRKYLSDILSAQKIWCQGFSEPEAGSDLANIKTKAVSSENGFIINGQKIWTSFAHIADYCFLLCRTSEHEKKHQGLTYLLVDMRSSGITTRPLTQISGDSEFNEVFFDNVVVPKENVVGNVGEGWTIAISTLMFERVVLTFARQLQSEVALRELLQQLNSDKTNDNSILKVRLADAVAEASAVRALAYRHLLDYSNGAQAGPEGSLDKLFWSESFQKIAKLGVVAQGWRSAYGETNDNIGYHMHRYLYSRGRTIAAGSSEIQRSIIAERILQLPKSR
jgi:alkylation response protein AidB-like acyl-CoA dehydrogenase